MNRKIRVAFIYKKSYNYFQTDHFDKTTYQFFMNALGRNPDLDVTYFPADDKFDTTQLKGKYDVILLPNNRTDGTPDQLIGIHKTEIPVISRTGDPHSAQRYDLISFHNEWKIDCYFGTIPKSYFYKFYPKHFKYEVIIFGLESHLYQNLKPFKNRIKDKILNSGAVGKTNLKSRIANSILNPRHSSWYFYKLRTKCNKLPYVDYSGMKGKNYINEDYSSYLSQYRAAIAATTFYPTQKYWEIPAAGCLTFMEITPKNNGEYLGFKDRKTAIFINEKNYREKFEEYLNDLDNPTWEEIAVEGRNYTLANLNNDKATEALVKLIKNLL